MARRANGAFGYSEAAVVTGLPVAKAATCTTDAPSVGKPPPSSLRGRGKPSGKPP